MEYIVWTGCPGKDKAFARLLYATSFFHAIALGRKAFGAVGWNVPYDFNESDFKTCVLQLQQFLNGSEHISYTAIFSLYANCIYGGRVSDEWDQRTLCTLLGDFLNKDMVSDPFYRFAQHNSCDYILPRRPERREICQYITAGIPRTDPANVYGIHEYTNAYFGLAHSTQLIETIVQLPSKVNQANRTFTEFDEDIMRDCGTMIEKVNTFKEVVDELFNMKWSENLAPMMTFLYQELQWFQRLWQEIEWTCRMAEKVFGGQEYMSPHMETVFAAVKQSRVPQSWMTNSYPSVKPLAAYLDDFDRRMRWLLQWKRTCHVDVYWMSAFFHPRKFIGFLLQQYASYWEVTLSDLTYDINVLDVQYRDYQ